MLWLLSGRLLSAIFTMFLVSILIFVATIALPGDAATAVLGRMATPESLAAFRLQHHLDDPLIVQYSGWIGGVLVGDFGTSIVSNQNAGDLLLVAGARTLILMLAALIIGFPLGTSLGILAAVRRGGFLDQTLSFILLAITGIPEFALAVLCVLLFSTGLFHLFPAVSLLREGVPILTQIDLIVLPVMTLVLTIIPYIALTVRSCMIEVMESDFIAMARLKGVAEGRVIFRHALVNASGPLIQVFAVSLVYMAGGAVIVETVFQFPGFGATLVDAVRNRDLVMVQATTLVLAMIYIGVNIIADCVVIILTPRLRTKITAQGVTAKGKTAEGKAAP